MAARAALALAAWLTCLAPASAVLRTSTGNGVQVLTGDTFEAATNDGFWLAEFYAPW